MYLSFYDFRPLVTTKIVEWNSKALTKETSSDTSAGVVKRGRLKEN